MANFVVSFRIGSSVNYDEKWQSVVKIVHEIASSTVWDETSSFFAFEATGTASEICNRIYLGSDLFDTRDMLVVFETGTKELAHRGLSYPHTLSSAIGATRTS